ncbi:36382_t:CDS:2, partial [Gigaspora margarita]
MIRRILSLEKNFQSVKESSREKKLNLLVKKIDTFFERQDTRGYKFEIDPKGNVFIVEIEMVVHASVVTLLQYYFKIPNGGVIVNPPIDVLGSSAHYQPNGEGKPSAPDIAIYPRLTIIPMPPIPDLPPQCRLSFHSSRLSQHLEISAVDTSVGSVSQNYHDWNAKCSRWMQQQYVRCVFDVKIYHPKATQNKNGCLDRCMIARLWTCQAAPAPGRYTAVNFGTPDYYIGAPTTCIGPGLGNYQVNIPTQNVFWDLPIVRRAPSTD